MSGYPAGRCIDGLSHSWCGDRTLYCEKCNEIRPRSEVPRRKSGRRDTHRPLAAALNPAASAPPAPRPVSDSCDKLVARIERDTGQPPSMWREGRLWVVEVRDPYTENFVRFEAEKLSLALKHAAWAKWGERVGDFA